MYKISVFNDISGLAQLEDDWLLITDSCSNVPFYQMYEWYHAYLGCLEPQPHDVFFFEVKKNQEPVSIFPLKRQLYNWHGIQLRAWVTPRTDEIALSDFIARDKNTVATEYRYVIEKLNSDKELRFDGVFLRRVLEGGNAWSLIADDSIKHKVMLHHSFSKHLKCRSDDKGIVPGGSTKFRRNLRRLEKRLNTKGDVSWQYDVALQGQDDAFSSFLDVEESGWKGSDGTKTAIKLNSRAKAFYKELIESFGALGRCRINFLRLNGNVIAGQYCLLDDGKINLLKIGYDQSFKDCSPGYLLIKNTLEKGCENEEFDELDFVTGAGWNDVFQPIKKNVYIAYLMNTTLKGRLFFGYTYAVNKLRGMIHHNG